ALVLAMSRHPWSVGADASGTGAGAQRHTGPGPGSDPRPLAAGLSCEETPAMTLFDGLVALGRWGQQHPQVLWGTMGGAFLVGTALRVLTGGHRRGRDMHGSARWATYREVKRSGLSRRQG